MAKPQGKCIFCNGPGLTKEHIWSEWTYKVVPKRTGTRHRSQLIVNPSNPWFYGIDDQKVYQGEVNSIKVRAVCGTCNFGWMSRLEEQAKPFLKPMMLGRPVTLEAPDQTTVATWLTVKFLMTETREKRSVVSSRNERESVKLAKRPPDNWTVWIASLTGENWRTKYQRSVLTMGHAPKGSEPAPYNNSFTPNTQFISLGFGSLFAAAFSTALPELEFRLPDEAMPFVRRVWPKDHGAIIWPPPYTLSDTGAQFIANALIDASRRIPHFPGADDT